MKREKITFRYDFLRNAFQGITEAGFRTFVLLVAIRVFHAPGTLKAFISGAENLGMFLTFVSFSLFTRLRISATRLAGIYFFLEAFFLLLVAISDTLWEYIFAILFAKLIYRQYTPLMTQVYAENYSEKTRGKRLSVVLLFSAIVGILFSKGGGYWLDLNLQSYWKIFGLMAIASFMTGIFIRQIPSNFSPREQKKGHFLSNFNYLIRDPLFGKMILGWTFLGFGNFMTIPMRVEYLVQEQCGICANNQIVALMIFILPAIGRIGSMPLWGWLFDRMRFIPLRLIANGFWLIGLFCFFNFKNFWLIGLGGLCIGIAMGGGFLMWNLWVIKIAPTEKTGAYMSVHTSIAGLRGIVSPFVGYAILALPHMTPVSVGWVGIIFTLLSLLTFASLVKEPRIA